MILNIRGASGSGKSTLARAVMSKYRVERVRREGRRNPLGYLCTHRELTAVPRLFVVGHYEIANGGLDTVDLDEGWALVATHAARRRNVLVEGKTLRDRWQNVAALAARWPCRIVLLTTPVDECVRRIRRRVGPSGRTHDIAPHSVEAMARKCATDAQRLREAGFVVDDMTLEEAVAQCHSWLEMT